MYCTEKIMFVCDFVLNNQFLVLQYITIRKTAFNAVGLAYMRPLTLRLNILAINYYEVKGID